MNIQQKAALERLIAVAKRDTGQCRRVANFLLSWWNTPVCGAWDVTDIWSLNRAITNDIFVVFGFIAQGCIYPDALGYYDDFQEILHQWRPQLCTELTEGGLQ